MTGITKEINDLILDLESDKNLQKNEAFLCEIFFVYEKATCDAMEVAERHDDKEILVDAKLAEKKMNEIYNVLFATKSTVEENLIRIQKAADLIIKYKTYFQITI